ncbi:hypothetical protein GIB67_007793, partial [Kingdonia uniflora]
LDLFLFVIMAGLASEGSQFNGNQYDSKMNELIGEDGENFWTLYEEIFDTSDKMGLKENLLRGIFAYVILSHACPQARLNLRSPLLFSSEALCPSARGFDVIQQAQSGTGKTGTFCSGILQRLDFGSVRCQALVLAPTRELAQQIERVMLAIGDYLGVKVHACVGGRNVRDDIRILQSGVHVVVGTPRRVFDMLGRQSLRSDYIKMFVLDEADEMLSRGFKDQVSLYFLCCYSFQNQDYAFPTC